MEMKTPAGGDYIITLPVTALASLYPSTVEQDQRTGAGEHNIALLPNGCRKVSGVLLDAPGDGS